MKIRIKIKAKARSFCQTIKTIKNGGKKNPMFNIPFHRNQKLA